MRLLLCNKDRRVYAIARAVYRDGMSLDELMRERRVAIITVNDGCLAAGAFVKLALTINDSLYDLKPSVMSQS